MDKVTINGYNIYFYDNGCNVEEYLKQGKLFGADAALVISNHFTESYIGNGDFWVFDGGAHIGTFALPIATKSKVILVEAASKNVECLKKTFENFANVEIHEAILADKEKRCDFSRESGPFGWILDNEEGMFTTTTIDKIVGDRHIAVLKLDIEGSEVDAFEGAKKTIWRCRPLIYTEVNGFCLMQRGLTCEDLLKKVASFGYTLFVPQLQMFIDPEKPFPFCTIDILAIPNEIEYAAGQNNYMKVMDIAKSNYPPDEVIDHIRNEVIKVSNEDCLSYFRKIGYVQ